MPSANQQGKIAPPQTLFEKVWAAHSLGTRNDGRTLLYMDRVVVDDVRAPHIFQQLERKGYAVRRPDLVIAVQDHSVPTFLPPGEHEAERYAFINATRAAAHRHGVRLLDIGGPDQGISHVVAPDLGIVLPGTTYACVDSHAPTVGGMGALGFGCGSSELEHVLATQIMAVLKPQTMHIQIDGTLPTGVFAKDVILKVISQLGVDGASGYAIEFSGSVVSALSIEGRLTLCNMAIEMGGRTGQVAPDETTLAWLAKRPLTPTGKQWEAAEITWRELRSDDGAKFDKTVFIECNALEPQISWGTNPSQSIGISEYIPFTDDVSPNQRPSHRRSLDYIGLTPGTKMEGIPINRVFIGSCTNSRLSDLKAAADVLKGQKIASGIKALVVPGSASVKREAEAMGLDAIFKSAGFAWGAPGCAMCAGGGGTQVAPGERCLSTTNRNFENRQGPGVRTHIASPAMVAAAAITGRITDVRKLMQGAT